MRLRGDQGPGTYYKVHVNNFKRAKSQLFLLSRALSILLWNRYKTVNCLARTWNLTTACEQAASIERTHMPGERCNTFLACLQKSLDRKHSHNDFHASWIAPRTL